MADKMEINDKLGHIVGDQVLNRLAHMMIEYFPDEIVGRLGGDEFVVFIKGKCDKEKINNTIKKSGVAEFYDKPTKLTLTSCCGVAASPENGNTFEDLYAAADKALYRSKNSSHSIVYCNTQNEEF